MNVRQLDKIRPNLTRSSTKLRARREAPVGRLEEVLEALELLDGGGLRVHAVGDHLLEGRILDLRARSSSSAISMTAVASVPVWYPIWSSVLFDAG